MYRGCWANDVQYQCKVAIVKNCIELNLIIPIPILPRCYHPPLNCGPNNFRIFIFRLPNNTNDQRTDKLKTWCKTTRPSKYTTTNSQYHWTWVDKWMKMHLDAVHRRIHAHTHTPSKMYTLFSLPTSHRWYGLFYG